MIKAGHERRWVPVEQEAEAVEESTMGHAAEDGDDKSLMAALDHL